jgi:hypothetical protein
MSEADPRSLLELLAALARDIPELLQKEVRLARSEATRALDLVLVAVRWLALGSAIAVSAVGVALAAIVSAISALLIARGIEPPIADVVATTSVTLVAVLIASLLFISAVHSLRAARASLDQGVQTLTESAANVMEKF